MSRSTSIALLLTTLAGGCGGASGPTALLTIAPSASAQVLASTPWPSDLFLDDGGHIALTALPTTQVDLTQPFLDDLHQVQDGFGVATGAYFPISDAIDPATLDGNVHLYDLASGAEIPITTSLRTTDIPMTIFARPKNGQVLLEHHSYGYVVTRAVKGPKGALAPSGDLSALLAAKSAPSGALARAYALYQPLFALLDKGSISRSDVAAATVFTTHTITASLRFMRAALEQAPAPKATVTMIFAKTVAGSGDAGTLDSLLGTPAQNLPGLDNPGGIAHDHIGYVVQGTFPSPDYLDNTTALTAAGATPSSIDVIDDAGFQPKPKGTATVPFTLVLPDFDGAPAKWANVPVVLFQHGIGGDRSAEMAVANTLAAAGFATLGIDIPFHGARDATAKDVAHTFGTTAGPDGWPEVSDAPFITFLDATGNSAKQIPPFMPRAVRSAFMQAAFDMMQETRLVTVGDLSDLTTKEPRLATLTLRHDAVAYSGESFGSIIGTIANAIEPSIGAAVLDVGGAGLLMPLLLNSAEFAPKIAPFLDGALGTSTGSAEDPSDTDFAYNLAQMLLEEGDPIAYAPYVLMHPLGSNAPKHVLQPSAHLDETVPNISNEALAGGLGLQPVNLSNGATVDLAFWPDAPPALSAGASGNVMVGGKPVTAAFIQFEPAVHDMLTHQTGQRLEDVTQGPPYPALPQPVPVMNPIERLQTIYVSFLTDYFAGRTPAVIDGE